MPQVKLDLLNSRLVGVNLGERVYDSVEDSSIFSSFDRNENQPVVAFKATGRKEINLKAKLYGLSQCDQAVVDKNGNYMYCRESISQGSTRQLQFTPTCLQRFNSKVKVESFEIIYFNKTFFFISIISNRKELILLQ